MKEVGHALFLAIVLSIAREKASTEGNTVIERKEEKMFAIFRNINKGMRHDIWNQITCSNRGGGGYSLYWPIRGGSTRKEYLFHASGL